MLATFQDLKDSGVAARVNLCPDDARFMAAANRAISYLLSHGAWWGTEPRAQFCVTDACFTAPACVASVNGIYNGCRAVDMKGKWYQFLPYAPAPTSNCATLVYQAYDQIPTARDIGAGGIIRSYAGSTLDYGKRLTFLGYDLNKIWVRTLNAGVMQDGETVTLGTPWIDTVTAFGSVTAVQKEVTTERVTVFSHEVGNSVLTPLSTYEYWETRPSYQRYQIPSFCSCSHGADCTSCRSGVIDALVKLEFIPIRRAQDYLLIGNIPALEMALEALKAKDDGDLAKFDTLMFGTAKSTRIGCLPLLQAELRTYTNDRFTANVNLFGTAPLRRKFAGFI